MEPLHRREVAEGWPPGNSRPECGCFCPRDHGCLQTLGVCKPVAAIVAALSAHIDETSWSEANEKAWLWVGQTEDLTAFTIADNRGADVARSILGTDREKVVISDRFPSYDWIEQHQQARRGAGSRSVPRCPYSPE
jgi:hypothetical protein